MKNFILFSPLILLLVLTSCDGRESKIDRIKNAITDFNHEQRFIDIKVYYPERYTETKTDSIISNTFSVSVKNYTVMDRDIILKQSLNNIHKRSEFHRVFESDITVVVDGNIIYSRHISVENFRDFESTEFWNNATLEHVWVNQEQSNSSTLSLSISMINPKDKAYKLYEILIDTSGNERLTVIEDHS